MDFDAEEAEKEIPIDINFEKFYKNLPEKSETLFRFFEWDDYVTVHDTNADYIAMNIMKGHRNLKSLGSSKISSLSFKLFKLDLYLKELLLVCGYRVEIYSRKLNNQWTLKAKASPGNLGELEEKLYSNAELLNSCGLIAVNIDLSNDSLSVAYVDQIERSILIADFDDNSNLTSLEAMLVQVGPRECIFPESIKKAIYFPRFKEIFHLNNILLTDVKDTDFNLTEDEHKNILKYFSKKSSAFDELKASKPNSLSSLNAAFRYIKLYDDEQNYRQYLVKRFNIFSFMRLDSTAIQSLDLFQSKYNSMSSKTSSLFGVLNKCKTVNGQKLLASWIRQPLTDIKLIEERLNLVQFFVVKTSMRERLRSTVLEKVPDLIKLSKKFHLKKATLSDCLRVLSIVKCLPTILSICSSDGDETIIKDAILDVIKDADKRFEKYKDLIDEMVVLSNETREPIVNPAYSEDLSKLKKKLDKYEKEANLNLEKTAKSFNIDAHKGMKLEYNSSSGFCFRVTKACEKSVRNKKLYKRVDSTKSDGIRFMSKELEEINKSYLNIKSEYDTQQEDMVKGIIEAAATHCENMRHLGGTLAYLDVLISLACVASNSTTPYVRPVLADKGSGVLILDQVRHPCLEMQPNVSYIPNDVRFNEKKFFILTGPNMGGKSTYIRSIAICVLMAQMGSFVPATGATISIVDQIFTRVGAGDNQMDGVSTFMMEMTEANSILNSATENSLVILDELGRGTSTYDGFGLTWAISEHIANKIKCFCLFATHFFELTNLSDEIPCVGNLHLTVKDSGNAVTLLYKVEEGKCDNSYGLRVAKLVNFPDRVINNANEMLESIQFSNLPSLDEQLKSKFGEIDFDLKSDEEKIAIIKSLRS